MPARSGTDALVEVEEALAAVVRQVNLPRIQERLSAETGVVLDRGAIQVLRCVAAEEAVRVSEVARLVHLDPSTVSRHVRHLEQMGLVARAAHDGDGRARVLRLTARAAASSTRSSCPRRPPRPGHDAERARGAAGPAPRHARRGGQGSPRPCTSRSCGACPSPPSASSSCFLHPRAPPARHRACGWPGRAVGDELGYTFETVERDYAPRLDVAAMRARPVVVGVSGSEFSLGALDAACVAIGSGRHRGLAEVGSVGGRVLHAADRPVLVVPSRA